MKKRESLEEETFGIADASMHPNIQLILQNILDNLQSGKSFYASCMDFKSPWLDEEPTRRSHLPRLIKISVENNFAWSAVARSIEELVDVDLNDLLGCHREEGYLSVSFQQKLKECR